MPNCSDTIKMAEIYRFMAVLMHYPSPSWFDRVKDVLDPLLNELTWQADILALQDCTSSPDFIDTLQVEHTRLFINGFPKVVAPPYGSVHLAADGSLNGPSTEKTLHFYQEKGFTFNSDAEHHPDHLISELEFLALLSAEDKHEDEELFLSNYFRPWFTIFRDKVLEGAEHPFYRTTVKLIDFFTREEEDYGLEPKQT